MKSINAKIYNYSKFIKTDELIKCLDLLPYKYTKLNNKIFIFKSYTDYLLFCIKHFDFFSLSMCLYRYKIRLFTKNDITGFYSRQNRNIVIIEKTILDYIDIQLTPIKVSQEHSKYATDDVLNNYKYMWVKFIALNTIIHEITHALQHHKKEFSFSKKNIPVKWGDDPAELDAIKSCIFIFNRHHNEFRSILNVRGIKIDHSLSPLRTSFKYHIELEID